MTIQPRRRLALSQSTVQVKSNAIDVAGAVTPGGRFLFSAACARGQVPVSKPTTAEAQALLTTRPDLVAQLRQRFVTADSQGNRSTRG